jgi:hypothetical protein
MAVTRLGKQKRNFCFGGEKGMETAVAGKPLPGLLGMNRVPPVAKRRKRSDRRRYHAA